MWGRTGVWLVQPIELARVRCEWITIGVRIVRLAGSRIDDRR